MPDKQKFSDEDMAKLKELQDKFNNIVLVLGQISIEIIKTDEEKDRLLTLKSKTENDFKQLKSEEKQLAEALTKTYGAGILNPKTGEFTPQENKSN